MGVSPNHRLGLHLFSVHADERVTLVLGAFRALTAAMALSAYGTAAQSPPAEPECGGALGEAHLAGFEALWATMNTSCAFNMTVGPEGVTIL